MLYAWLAMLCVWGCLSSHGPDTQEQAQFLTLCDATCPADYACICGVCTLACEDDRTCAVEAEGSKCFEGSDQVDALCGTRTCDLECDRDHDCTALGRNFQCMAGRCRGASITQQKQDLDAGPPVGPDASAPVTHPTQNADAGPPVAPDSGEAGADSTVLEPLPTCEARRPIVAACTLTIEGSGEACNDCPPLMGTIVAMGEDEARAECFASDNWPRAIPPAPQSGEPAPIPEQTMWWRIDDGAGSQIVIGVAAPGLATLGVTVGDRVAYHSRVNWSGWDWPDGTDQLEIEGRGRLVLAVNDASYLKVSEGKVECERQGACGGYEWSARVTLDAEEVVVPVGKFISVDASVITNAHAVTHGDAYVEPDEEVSGLPDCDGPKTEFLVSLVEAL